jgi:hypothetical protein
MTMASSGASCAGTDMISLRFLRALIVSLPKRRIILAREGQQNFVTFEAIDTLGERCCYAVFFEVSIDKLRTGRLMLRVQSAYALDRGLSKRQRTAKRVTLRSILLAALQGRRIRP